MVWGNFILLSRSQINNHFAQNFDDIMPTLMDNLCKPIVKDFFVGLLEYLLTNRKLKWQTTSLINHVRNNLLSW